MANSMKKIESYFSIAYRAVGIGVVIVTIAYYVSEVNTSAVRAEDKLTAQIEANKAAIEANRILIIELRKEVNEAISYIRLIGTNTDRITEIENDVQKNTEEILKK